MSLLLMIVFILLINFVGSYYFKRFDLTTEKRYTCRIHQTVIAEPQR